jgi:hypothetical protein
MAIVSKDRTELFEGANPFVITEETGKMIAEWCDRGESVKEKEMPVMTAEQFDKAILSEGKVIDKFLAAITKGTLIATTEQILLLQNKVLELKNVA